MADNFWGGSGKKFTFAELQALDAEIEAAGVQVEEVRTSILRADGLHSAYKIASQPRDQFVKYTAPTFESKAVTGAKSHVPASMQGLQQQLTSPAVSSSAFASSMTKSQAPSTDGSLSMDQSAP
ncbi:MAG: hypothetical protein K5Q00_00765 [Gammaproteobacteria bacterium]|nr:hypothetical protein [Gammaproteobacteria bacterium]